MVLRPRTLVRDDLPRASWIALLGLAVVLVGVVAGMPIAGQLVSDKDDAAAKGIVSGALAGTVLGSVIVGAPCGRAGLARKTTLLTAFAAQATLVSLPH
jgi:hypothetical protein